jgi:hypothetical protein
MLNSNFSKPTYTYKRFRVKKADGSSTTVSVDPELVIKACQTVGSLASVGKIVREAALSFESEAEGKGKNRSAHVSKRLRDMVVAANKPGTVSAELPVAA